jgi:DNA-directed RNA polymerase sigma subunit (sigma70/sigma32)
MPREQMLNPRDDRECTLTETAQALPRSRKGAVVSREYVRQIETKALAKLRAELEARGISSEILGEPNSLSVGAPIVITDL